MIGRAMIVAFIGVPFGVPFLAIPNSSNFAIQVVFKALIPLIPCGFVIFGVSNPIMVRLKLTEKR